MKDMSKRMSVEDLQDMKELQDENKANLVELFNFIKECQKYTMLLFINNLNNKNVNL